MKKTKMKTNNYTDSLKKLLKDYDKIPEIKLYISKFDSLTGNDNLVHDELILLHNYRLIDEMNSVIHRKMPYVSDFIRHRGGFIKKEIIDEAFKRNDYVNSLNITYGNLKELQKSIFEGEIYKYSEKQNSLNIPNDNIILILKKITDDRNKFMHNANHGLDLKKSIVDSFIVIYLLYFTRLNHV
jgi:hypothetical protein